MLLSVLELGVDETEPFAGKQGHRATGSTFIGTVLVAQPRCARSARNRLMHSEEDKDAVLDCNDVLYWNCDRVGLDRHPARSLTRAQDASCEFGFAGASLPYVDPRSGPGRQAGFASRCFKFSAEPCAISPRAIRPP
jgi:hypothetical protein